MAFREQQERNRYDIYILIFFLLTSLVMISLSDNTSLTRPKEIGLSIASTLQSGLHQTKRVSERGLNSFREIKKIRELYMDSLSELDSYQGIERELEQLQTENEHLRELLNFSEKSTYYNIPAEVIARDPENFFSSITINKGSRDGLRSGDAVITYQNGIMGLVGRIVEVGVNSSIILPITDSSSYIASRLQESRYEGLVNGQGDASSFILMNFVSQKAVMEIRKEDLVETSGLNSHFPEGIIIGRVINIKMQEYARTLELEIEPSIELSKLEYVMVIKEEEQ